MPTGSKRGKTGWSEISLYREFHAVAVAPAARRVRILRAAQGLRYFVTFKQEQHPCRRLFLKAPIFKKGEFQAE